MATSTSQRVSSRLADKRSQPKSSNWRDDVFEYSPVISSMKKERGTPKEKKVVVITQLMSDDYRRTKPEIEVKDVLSKSGQSKSTRMTKANDTMKGATIKTRLIQTGGTLQLDVNSSCEAIQTVEYPEWSDDLVAESTTEILTIKQEDTSKDISSLVTELKKSAKYNSSQQIFPLAAAVLPDEIKTLIPSSVLQQVTAEAGVVLQDCGDGVQIVFGNPEVLLETSKMLSSILQQMKAESTDISAAEARDNKDTFLNIQPIPAVEKIDDAVLLSVDEQTIVDGEKESANSCQMVLTAVVEQADEMELAESMKGLSGRQGPRRRQNICRHHKEKCDKCTAHCSLCNYRSSKLAVNKHMRRCHPVNTFDCEICEMQFGIRYDMRRHRMIHFNKIGHLTPEATRILEIRGRTDLLKLTLSELEVNFSMEEPTVKQPNNSQVQDVARDNTVPVKITKEADTGPKDISCGFCDYIGHLDSIESHHNSYHRTANNINMEHVCSLCDQGFTLDDLREHYLNSCGKDSGKIQDVAQMKVRCRMCLSKGSEKMIRAHIESHALKVQCLLCDFCGSISLMEIHLQKYHGNAKNCNTSVRYPPKESCVLYKCGVCSNIFKTRASLQMHFKKHEVSTIYKCEYCEFEVSRLGLLNAHMRKKHASLADRECKICGKVFNHVNSLQFHRESVHGIGRTSHKCEHCKKIFTTKRFLQVHIKRVHQKLKGYTCPVCHKSFFEKSRMLEHQNVHLTAVEKAARRFVCSYCGKSYSHKSVLRQHENVHLGIRPYKCDQCAKTFTFTAELYKHKVSHSSNRPHVCKHCGKGFKFPYKLASHLVTHTKQGRHCCRLCDKVYTSLSSLRKHLCSSGEPLTQHMCTGCDRLFSDLSTLQKHDCKNPDLDELLIISDECPQSVIIQTDSTTHTKSNVMQIFTEVMDTDITNESVITHFEADSLADVKLEDVKTAYDTTEGMESVLYMCCVCSNLFVDQNEVNSHMVLEHGAEAVIAQDYNATDVNIENSEVISEEIHASNVDNENYQQLLIDKRIIVTECSEESVSDIVANDVFS